MIAETDRVAQELGGVNELETISIISSFPFRHFVNKYYTQNYLALCDDIIHA